MKDKDSEKKTSSEIDLQFEKMIKSVMEEQGYFKQEDVKPLMIEILKQLDPIVSKHVKNHLVEIGKFIINNCNDDKNGDIDNAETS